MAPSLLDRALGGAQTQREAGEGNRRQSGGGRSSPYARPAGDKWSHDKFGSDDSAPPAAAPSAAKGGSLASRLGVSGGGAAGAPGGEKRSAKLVIKNLHYEVSERELELLFVQIGPIAAGPKIKFDRSGRSEGIAWVTYGSEEHAAQAKEAFNGAPAKGQPIEVDFDYSLNRASERGAPAAGSLLARLGQDTSRGPKFGSSPSTRDAPSGPRASRGRPDRGIGSDRGRGAVRGGRGGARGGEKREKRAPTTAGDLDAELEAFMKAPEAEGAAKPTEVAPPAPAAATGGDVEMA
ncbi:hypothetical protein JCM8097_000894 [Rhodosporidiobolus ruineniae]